MNHNPNAPMPTGRLGMVTHEVFVVVGTGEDRREFSMGRVAHVTWADHERVQGMLDYVLGKDNTDGRIGEVIAYEVGYNADGDAVMLCEWARMEHTFRPTLVTYVNEPSQNMVGIHIPG